MSVFINWKAKTVVVAVALSGPPWVAPQMTGKELKTLIRLITRPTSSAGRSSGRVISRYVCQGLVPSTFAAS